MKIFNLNLIAISLISLLGTSKAQTTDTIPKKGLSIALHSGFTSNGVVPLWMRSNQYGSVPLAGGSASVVLRSFRDYRKAGEWQGKKHNGGSLWDWGYGLEGRTNVGKTTQAQLIEAHAKLRFAMFEIRAGRSRDVMGLNGDTLLSSGNFAVSGNALGVPKFEISIPEYYRIPVFGGLFSFKGNFANGYMGKMEIDPTAFVKKTSETALPTLLHQKSFYGRVGKAHWKVTLYGGFNHQAQWGSERKVYGNNYDLSFIQTLWYVSSGKAYGNRKIPWSKIGNHQGSIDLGASYNFGNISMMLYRQNFYDVGALSKLANIKDGLNGLTLTNNRYKQSSRSWDWSKLLVEFFYSKDQAGYPWSKPTKSGDEDYYNNFFYRQGWSYNEIGLGTPFIVSQKSARAGQPIHSKDFFISNRVVALHTGLSGHVKQWNLHTKLSYAKHYGTFGTSEFGKSTGRVFHPPYKERFIPVSQFSAIFQGERLLSKRLYVGGTIAADQGKLLDNSIGFSANLRKTF